MLDGCSTAEGGKEGAAMGAETGGRGCCLVLFCGEGEVGDGDGELLIGAFGPLGCFGSTTLLAEHRLPEPRDPWEEKTVDWQE